MALKRISPIEGGICAPLGFRAASVYAGIRKDPRPDLTLIASGGESNAAGVFTTNQVRAWCVQNNQHVLKAGKAWAIVCNAGNANCCTGPQGQAADFLMRSAALDALGLEPGLPVLTASTGVIGRPMPTEDLRAHLSAAARELLCAPGASLAAAKAIMTTDLFHKEVAVEVETRRGNFRIGGIAKGSGMIAPNMATMLAFITTDAVVEPAVLQKHLATVCDVTFNCLSVDGDTSTNDMALILASGKSGVPAEMHDPAFDRALYTVCETLAKMIARDGEGATKLITVRVADCSGDARKVAKAIAESPLVKTALFGNDPNWGRILMAAGKAGVAFDPDKASVSIGGMDVFRDGASVDASLECLQEKMAEEEVEIMVDLGDLNGSSATVWTCDFSYDYVRINAEYTT